MEEGPDEVHLLKSPGDIYSSHENNQKLSYFYNSNRIISSHVPIHQFFKHFSQYSNEEQQKIMNQILVALRAVSTNAYLLNQQLKGRRNFNLDRNLESESQKHLLTVIVDLLMNNVNNYLIFNLLLQVFEELLPFSPLEDMMLFEAISKLTVNFYQSDVKAAQLFAASHAIKSYFNAKIMTERDPGNMLVFHGTNRVQILPSGHKPLTWILKEGFTLFFWINLQNIKSSVEASLPKLFTFYTPDAGGMEAYLIDNKIYYRIIGPKYTEPQIGSNGIFLGQIQGRKWTFLAFEHEGHHTFQKSKLKFYINKSKPLVFGLDPPKISSSSPTKYIFFDKSYSRTSSVCLFPMLIGQQGIDEFNKNFNSINTVKSNRAYVFENKQGKVYERSGLGSSHNYIFERNDKMNFEIVLPLFYLLRFQQKDQQYPTLNQLLNVFILFLRQSSNTQIQAYKNGYFKTISQLITEVPRNIFDENTIKSILHIKHTITDTNLLDQYFSDFLWQLLYANIPMARKEQILEIIKNAFAQNIAHYSTQIGLDQMINLLQKIQGGSLNCCEKHFKIASNKFERTLQGQSLFGEEKKAQSYLFSLIQSTLQNSKLHFPQQIYKLCRLLCLKCSPCFILELMSLIRKLLTQKFTQRMSEQQTKQIVKYFQEKKVHYLFIHLIENQFFAEIKAESVKLIYSLLIKRSSIEEETISHMISKSLWKINEFVEEQISPNKSLKKSESIQEEIPELNVERQFKPPMMEQIEEEEEKPFELVGPQAPALSNRLKGKKTFDFGFVDKKSSRQREIMEQEKTTEPLEPESQPPVQMPVPLLSNPPNKKDKKFFLKINTEAINEMYTFGGEKGQQIIISQDQEQMELEKIIKLAKKCVTAMKGQELSEENQQKDQKRPSYVPPPMTTTNKAAANKKKFNLRLISEEEDEVPPVKIPTPLATKKSNKTPTSIKSSNEENLYTLYNSLLESCLGVSFQTCLISNSKVQVPSILGIFFNWIPQTDLETKFLNDLDIILESAQNMALIIELPQLYDFLFELCYKCLLFEEMKQKRVYVQKLQNIIKVIYSYIYRQDLAGFSKFSFILNWVEEKKHLHYEPKCLFLTSRYVLLLILECTEELLIMNNSNNPIMQRNFQALAVVLDTLKKIIPEDYDELNIDNFERVVFTSDFQLPNSLVPYFKSQWADFILYQKYLFIFKRFYSTDWYNKGLKQFSQNQNNFLDYLMQSNQGSIQKEASYYLKGNFLTSLIEIQRAMLLQVQHTQPKEAEQFGFEAVWQTILLVVLVQTNKQKTIKSQRSQIILAFLKSCKLLAEKGIERIVDIVPMLSNIKHYLSISSQSQNAMKTSPTVILDDIISNYIPEYLLNMGKTDLESFILNFSEVWIPNQNQYKKMHSDLFITYREKVKKQKDFNFNQFVSNLLEEENERKQFTDVILDAHSRTIKNNFRKLWYNMRIYNPLWSHPHFKWQQDTLYNKSLYSYEKYQSSQFLKYKVAKQMSKGKGRFFLKPQLIEPDIVSKVINENERNHQVQYNLEKALTVMNQHLMIGSSKKGWIASKSQDSLYFLMGFKKVKIINTLTVRNGYLAIISENLVFIASKNQQKTSHLTIDNYHIRHDKALHKCWPLEYIKQVYRRRYVNKRRSVLIYFIHGKTLILDFGSEEEADQFCKKILKLKHKCINISFIAKTADPRKNIQNMEVLKKWMNYQISTFDYLMEVNTFAGRAFSDLTQYPVFPWILINFGATKPKLNDETTMRNLAFPMGANGTEERVNNFQQRYEVMHVDDEYATKFHYGTHYSSPGIIYHFLVRLTPYTEGSVLLQSGKFDFADRLFFSFPDSYKNAISEYSDVRQLIPDLYCIPEAYLNVNGLDFGVMQNKKRVHNLQLPEWSRDNPYLFVSTMRKSLEEEMTCKMIHHWMDLIFGYKQRGEEAIKALNCYYYLTYDDAVPWDKLTNEKEIQSIESQIVNFGQTPSQIFTKPHHQRTPLSTIRNFKMICDYQAEPRVYRPTKNNKPMVGEVELNPFKQPDESIIFMKWVSQSKVVFIRKSGDIVFYKCSSNTNAASKVPFQCTVEKEKKLQKIRKQIFDPNQYYDLSLNVQNFPLELIGGGHTICLGGLSDGKLVLIDVDTGSLTNGYHSHSHTISCVRSDSSRQNFLVTGDTKGNVIMWQIKTSHNVSKLVEKRFFKDQSDQITSIFFSSDLQCFATASMEGSVFLYNTITGKKLRAFYHPKKLPINQIVITSNPLAAIILFCNADNTIYSYSINGQLIARAHEKMFSSFLSPIIVKDSKLFEYLIFGNQKSQVHVRNLPFLDIPQKNVFKVAREVCVNKICMSKQNRFLVTGCSDGELTIITDPHVIVNV